jgi:hypothetical protein
MWTYLRPSFKILIIFSVSLLNTLWQQIIMDFHTTHAFSVEKADNSTNFAAGVIINSRALQIHSAKASTNANGPVVRWFTRGWIMWPYIACTSSPLSCNSRLNWKYFTFGIQQNEMNSFAFSPRANCTDRRPQLVGDDSAKFRGYRVSLVNCNGSLRH